MSVVLCGRPGNDLYGYILFRELLPLLWCAQTPIIQDMRTCAR